MRLFLPGLLVYRAEQYPGSRLREERSPGTRFLEDIECPVVSCLGGKLRARRRRRSRRVDGDMYRKLPLVRIKQKGSKEKVETFLPVLARQLVEKDALSCASFGLCSESPLEAKAAVTSAPATKMDCVLRPRFVRGQCVCVDAFEVL